MILLDTDICIEILRGNNNVIENRKRCNDDIAVSFMTITEFFYGAERSDNKNNNISLIEEFLLTVEVIQSDVSIMREFGKIKAKLYEKRITLADADIFIAATALTKCEKLITGNIGHFNKIENIKTENWIR